MTTPIVVFCKYLEEIKIVADELSHLKVAVLNGQTRNRSKMIEDFQAGLYDVIICQIKTGGVGIDLYSSCNAIFYSLTYSFIDYEQALARVHRYGQTRDVKIYLVYAKNTIDEAIYEAILSKKSISDTVLKSLKGVTYGKS
jgi:SNF2 family DNA or RNA helicase